MLVLSQSFLDDAGRAPVDPGRAPKEPRIIQAEAPWIENARK
jgi:hypothetical protein